MRFEFKWFLDLRRSSKSISIQKWLAHFGKDAAVEGQQPTDFWGGSARAIEKRHPNRNESPIHSALSLMSTRIYWNDRSEYVPTRVSTSHRHCGQWCSGCFDRYEIVIVQWISHFPPNYWTRFFCCLFFWKVAFTEKLIYVFKNDMNFSSKIQAIWSDWIWCCVKFASRRAIIGHIVVDWQFRWLWLDLLLWPWLCAGLESRTKVILLRDDVEMSRPVCPAAVPFD